MGMRAFCASRVPDDQRMRMSTARGVRQKINLPSPSTTARPIRKMMKMIHKMIFMGGVPVGACEFGQRTACRERGPQVLGWRAVVV
jgi:hypothetical protein